MTNQATILIVEDEPTYCDYYQEMLQDPQYNTKEYNISVAMDLETARAKLKELEPDIVLLDLRFPPRHESEEGLAFLKEIKAFNPITKVIIITGVSDEEAALTALRFGTYDFVRKDTESYMELPFRVKQAYERVQLERELKQAKQQINRVGGYLYAPGQIIIGTSSKMEELYRKIDSVAPTNATVLIRGDSGTGKELIAKAIHYQSPRRHRPMITVDCAAIPSELIESELFVTPRALSPAPPVRQKVCLRRLLGARYSWTKSGNCRYLYR